MKLTPRQTRLLGELPSAGERFAKLRPYMASEAGMANRLIAMGLAEKKFANEKCCKEYRRTPGGDAIVREMATGPCCLSPNYCDGVCTCRICAPEIHRRAARP